MKPAAALACAAVAVCAVTGPARALVPSEPTPLPASQDGSSRAMALLRGAVASARTRSWSATERVLSLSGGRRVETVARVEHGPGRPTSTDVLDDRLFSLLESHYSLAVAGADRVDGASTQVVEARRADGTLSARFWVDEATRLLLRREVLDRTGRLLRRTELLDVGPLRPGTTTAGLTAPALPRGERLDAASLARLEAEGWPVVRALPPHLELYEARWLPDGLLQLAFSDGLSTLSLFVQEGEQVPDGVQRTVAGARVWQADGEPERLVWVADGRTWTLVSDAEPEVVDEVVAELPRATRSRPLEEGVAPRLWRGMDRVGAWLNPFD